MMLGENLFELKTKWPIIYGNGVNETQIHYNFMVKACFCVNILTFKIVPKPGAPQPVVDQFNARTA